MKEKKNGCRRGQGHIWEWEKYPVCFGVLTARHTCQVHRSANFQNRQLVVHKSYLHKLTTQQKPWNKRKMAWSCYSFPYPSLFSPVLSLGQVDNERIHSSFNCSVFPTPRKSYFNSPSLSLKISQETFYCLIWELYFPSIILRLKMNTSQM